MTDPAFVTMHAWLDWILGCLAWARMVLAWLPTCAPPTLPCPGPDPSTDLSAATIADLGLDELLEVARHLDACSVAALARCSRDLRRLAPAAADRHEANLARARDFWTRWNRACQGVRNLGHGSFALFRAHRKFWTLFGATSDADQWRRGSWYGLAVLGDRIEFNTVLNFSEFTMTLDSEPFKCQLHPDCPLAIVESANGAIWRTFADVVLTEFVPGDRNTAEARAALDALQEPSEETRDLAARDSGDDAWLVARMDIQEHDARKARLLDAATKCGPNRLSRYAVRVMDSARSL